MEAYKMEALTLFLSNEQLQKIVEQIITELRTSNILTLNTLDNRYMNKKQTCEYLQISNNTLDSWISRGLPHIKINCSVRYDRLAIDNWLKEVEKTY